MKLLILGGPRFLGRALADAALVGGHELTFFNRGTTNAELYPDVERLVGDRGGDLAAFGGRSWDAVIDTSGFLPDAVRASAEALAGCGLYCFVSSISVYADFSRPVDEESAVAELGDLPRDGVTNESYGALKALCEQAVAEIFEERALVIRPGLITGPHDPTGRFTYWPHRFARGGEVLVPGPSERPHQSVDVRDLAEWAVALCECEGSGVFNATHPGLTWDDLVAACRTVAPTDVDVVWVPSEFLVEQEVGEWMELPLWIADPALAYADRVDVTRALATGLRFRLLEETVRGALEHAETTAAAGLSPERETALLAKWHAC